MASTTCVLKVFLFSLSLGFSFLVNMSGFWQFILFAFALRTVEGFGSAFYFTGSFTYITLLHPNSIGMVLVSAKGEGRRRGEGGGVSS